MRERQGYGYWKQSVEKLREKWTAFTMGIIRVFAEEEMRISREEFDRQIEARTRWPSHSSNHGVALARQVAPLPGSNPRARSLVS